MKQRKLQIKGWDVTCQIPCSNIQFSIIQWVKQVKLLVQEVNHTDNPVAITDDGEEKLEKK